MYLFSLSIKSVSGVYQGPVEQDEFLEAAAQGKMEVVEKFLEDGGDPNICDEVRYVQWHVLSNDILVSRYYSFFLFLFI